MKQRKGPRAITEVGRGSAGCVFAPAFRCAGEPNTNKQFNRTRKGRVSKLMSSGYANDEFSQSTVLRNHVDSNGQPVQGINNSSQFTVAATKKCDLEQKNRAASRYMKQIEGCATVNPANLNSAELLYMDNGGDDLSKTRFTIKDILPFFRSFQNLFDGLTRFQENDFVHMDIKKNNVVTRKNKDGSFTTRFIDFGQSIPLKDTYFANIRSPEIIQTHYFAWPPYSKFAGTYFYSEYQGGVRALINDVSGIVFHNYYPSVIDVIENEAPPPYQWKYKNPINIAPFIDFWTRRDVVKWIAAFKKKSAEEQNATKFTADLPIYEFVRRMMLGIDVHALGILLAGMYYSLVGQRGIGDGKYEMRGKSIGAAPFRGFADAMYKDVTEPLELLITGMMSHDVNAYTSIEEASRIYREEIMPMMEDYMTTPFFITLMTKYPGPQTKAGRTKSKTRKTTRKTKRKTST